MKYTIGEKQLNNIEKVLQDDLIELGVHCVCLIDMAGNIIATLDNDKEKYNIYSLAALSAANFGAVNAMAKIIGEEEFSLLFHKGKEKNIHFNRVISDFLLVIIFGMETSLGFLRLKVADTTEKIKKILVS